MNPTSPLVITLVSGKGGVGKTMLSVAVAKELSLSNRTLIVDLDFFNRGLTGLMDDGPPSCEIEKPGFLSKDDSEATIKWKIVQVAPNLFHIKYPDLLPEEMQRFETMDVNVLRTSLEAFIREAAQKCNCDCVVLDCHGGPDNSSFAACLFSDYSLLISEPDRITFYGTLNFLRQLKRIGGDSEVNLHLVFNKVVPAFSGFFLRSLYNRMIREHFSGRPLLAIFPLEVYLTKEFEKTPFLTAAYPNSLLARKTRTLLYDLLGTKHLNKLPPPIKSLPAWMRAYTRLTLGKQLPLLNMSVVMSLIVIFVVLAALLYLSFSQFFPGAKERLQKDITTVRLLQCVGDTTELRNSHTKVAELIDDPIYLTYDTLGFPMESSDQEIYNFRRCASPQINWSLGVSHTGAYEAVSADYRDYNVVTKRREVLRSLKPDSVPAQFRDTYEKSLTRLQNASRISLTLQLLLYWVNVSGPALMIIATAWLGLTLLITWSSQLDRQFTYSSRLHRLRSVLLPFFIALILWFLPLLGLAAVVQYLFEEAVRNSTYWFSVAGTIFLTAVLLALLSGQILRVYRDLRYEGNYLEDLLRAMFIAYLAFGPLGMYFLFMR